MHDGTLSYTMSQNVVHHQHSLRTIRLANDRNVKYQTRETVFHRDIQTPRRELKIRRAAEYFLTKFEVFG